MSIKPPPPLASTPSLQKALVRADEEMAYHDKRMNKRIRKLNGEPPPPFLDEETTGVMWIPDPFPRPAKA